MWSRGRRLSRHLAGCVLLTLAITPCTAADTVKEIRLLTVGNSFAYNATRYLRELAVAAGHRVEIGSANTSGCSLERHYNAFLAASEGDPAGNIYPPKVRGEPKRSLIGFLEDGKWDFVTIQQYSRVSEDPDSYRPHARRLLDAIRLRQPEAEVLVHQTWAYRYDDPRFKEGYSTHDMHRAIQAAYATISSELGLRLIPVGDAFTLAQTHPEWTYRPDPEFDFTSPKYPDLPNQPGSIHVGWKWILEEGEEPRFYLDGNHANLFGAYLGSCVFFELLFGETCVGNAFVPPGMTREQAHSLQTIAHATLSRQSQPAADRIPDDFPPRTPAIQKEHVIHE